MDRLTPEHRSWNMSRIRSRDTRPEKRVRSLLHRMGFRFSLRGKEFPGKPDTVLGARLAVVFVHGCFWHQHEGCRNATMPTTRRAFWEAKLKGNIARDGRVSKQLEAQGWRVITVLHKLNERFTSSYRCEVWEFLPPDDGNTFFKGRFFVLSVLSRSDEPNCHSWIISL